MSDFLEKLKESRRIAKMRMGQNAPDFVSLKSNPEIRLAMVPLLEREYQMALEAAASYDVADNSYGTELRDRVLQVHTLFYALREPDNVESKAFPDMDAMLDPEVGLEPVDVNYLLDYYQRMVDFSSPAMDGLNDEALDELKKSVRDNRLERALWKTVVASQAVFHDHAGWATAGQITLAFIHTELDWDERRARVHPWCVDKLEAEVEGRVTTCEICHEQFNIAEFAELTDKYQSEIYRPGDDVSKLKHLTDQEKTERRREIEQIFADPEKYQQEQAAKYAQADEEARMVTRDVE